MWYRYSRGTNTADTSHPNYRPPNAEKIPGNGAAGQSVPWSSSECMCHAITYHDLTGVIVNAIASKACVYCSTYCGLML